MISVLSRKGDDWKQCVRGVEVEQGVITPTLPPESATFQMKAGVPMEDAERSADCIRNHLGAGFGSVRIHEVGWRPSE